MIKGFKEFIMRGNLIDLAVAFVIGAASAKVIDTFVSAIVTPILNAFPGASVHGWGFSLRGGNLKGATFINFSSIINAVIVFLLTATVVYLVFVAPMQRIQKLRTRGIKNEPDAVGEDIQLLREIRDALAARPPGGSASPAPR
jgi:large conductance mechanosensitive channel